MIQAGNIPESVLEAQFNDIRGLFDQKERTTVRLAQLNNELSKLNNEMDELQGMLDSLSPSSSQVKADGRDVHRHLMSFEGFSKGQKGKPQKILE